MFHLHCVHACNSLKKVEHIAQPVGGQIAQPVRGQIAQPVRGQIAQPVGGQIAKTVGGQKDILISSFDVW